MDDQLLRELVAGQKEQTDMFRRYLWRIRFSLWSLLLLMTATALGLGYLVYEHRTKPAPISAGGINWTPPASQGTLRVYMNQDPMSVPTQSGVLTIGGGTFK